MRTHLASFAAAILLATTAFVGSGASVMAATTTLANLPLTNQFKTGTFATAWRPIPAGFQNVVITMSPTTGNPAAPFQGIAHPFNDPSKTVTFGVKYSWDGGLTVPDSVERTEAGNPQGQWIWAKGTNMTPSVTMGLVYDTVAGGIPPQTDPTNLDPRGLPTSYQAYVSTVNGPINSGLLVQENTSP